MLGKGQLYEKTPPPSTQYRLNDSTLIIMNNFISLSVALEDWFDKSLSEIPKEKRSLIEQAFTPMPWNDLSPEQRHDIAYQLDYQFDPENTRNRQYWEDFFWKMEAIEDQIKDWDKAATPTAQDIAQKEALLRELRNKLTIMKAQYKHAHNTYDPRKKQHGNEKKKSPTQMPNDQYISYPNAMLLLVEKWNATPEELAAWVYRGEIDGGLTAYIGEDKSNTLQKFCYEYFSDNDDYLAPLMACWFKKNDITNFSPTERYLTGKELIDRWGNQSYISPVDFIRAKINESRLLDMHPTMGVTQWNKSGSAAVNGEKALFTLSNVIEIETKDFGGVIADNSAVKINKTINGSDGLRASSTTQEAPGEVFRGMKNLSATELTMIFVGDKDEHGLGANNVLNISARGETRCIALSAIDLVDRRHGRLNKPCGILIGMAQGRVIKHTESKARLISRLREIFRKFFGINSDPFSSYQKSTGWKPHFKIIDNRGAADRRAREKAERYTDSFEYLSRRKEKQIYDKNSELFGAEDPESFEEENDAAGEWIKNHNS